MGEFNYYEISGFLKMTEESTNSYFIATLKNLKPCNEYIVDMCKGNIVYNLRANKNGRIKSMDRVYE
jgi:hypothetical protein